MLMDSAYHLVLRHLVSPQVIAANPIFQRCFWNARRINWQATVQAYLEPDELGRRALEPDQTRRKHSRLHCHWVMASQALCKNYVQYTHAAER
jgi:hypothetical protein